MVSEHFDFRCLQSDHARRGFPRKSHSSLGLAVQPGSKNAFIRACKTLVPAIAIAGALIVTPAFATRTHRAATSGHAKTSKKKTASHQIHGQRQIEPERAREIQTALIREHYLAGEPSGQWDAESQAAMSKFQADQGWQSKLTPDSRALIKLRLGPNQENTSIKPTNQASTPISGSETQHPLASSNSFTSPQTMAQ